MLTRGLLTTVELWFNNQRYLNMQYNTQSNCLGSVPL